MPQRLDQVSQCLAIEGAAAAKFFTAALRHAGRGGAGLTKLPDCR